jgi:hypothetical protein
MGTLGVGPLTSLTYLVLTSALGLNSVTELDVEVASTLYNK